MVKVKTSDQIRKKGKAAPEPASVPKGRAAGSGSKARPGRTILRETNPSKTAKKTARETVKKAASKTASAIPAAPVSRRKKVEEPWQESIDLLTQEKAELQNIGRRLKAERDSALAEATRLEERVRELESANSRQAGGQSQPAGPGEFDPAVDLEDEGPATAEDDMEGAAGFFDRMEELRARRIELDRERNDREIEQSDQSYWLVCPKCGDLMEEQEAENIKLERCDNCGGLYLDRGEVDLLLSLTTDRDGLRRLHNALKF